MLFPLSYVLCPISDCPFHSDEGASDSKPDAAPNEEQKKRNARIKAVVDWFYSTREKITGEKSGNYNGKQVLPKDRKAAEKMLRWSDGGTYTKRVIADRIETALKHQFTKNVPDTLAMAVCCFDSYIDSKRAGQRAGQRPPERKVHYVTEQDFIDQDRRDGYTGD